MHVNTDRPPEEIQHVYLHEATALRPDIAGAADREDGGP